MKDIGGYAIMTNRPVLIAFQSGSTQALARLLDHPLFRLFLIGLHLSLEEVFMKASHTPSFSGAKSGFI